MKVIPETSRVD